MTDRPSGESCGSRILGSSARSTSDIGRPSCCARIGIPGGARTARAATTVRPRAVLVLLSLRDEPFTPQSLPPEYHRGIVEWGLLMSERKYRQRGYQDEPRDREPRREKPAQEPRAPGRPLQDASGPRTPNLMASHEVFRCARCGNRLAMPVEA